MAVTITQHQTYDSGSGGFLSSHTFPDVDCSGSNTLNIACGINRNPASDVSGWTSEGNAMTSVVDSINTNVCAVSLWRYLINNSATTVVSSTPSFKLQAGFSLGLAGVDQTTPITGTPVTDGNFGTTATASYTGTAGNLLLVFVSTQNDRTFTASNCTTGTAVTAADGNLGSGWYGYVDATGSSQTIGATVSSNDNWRIAIIEIKAAAAGSLIKTFNGLAYASTKTVNGLAIASVKTKNGLA